MGLPDNEDDDNPDGSPRSRPVDDEHGIRNHPPPVGAPYQVPPYRLVQAPVNLTPGNRFF